MTQRRRLFDSLVLVLGVNLGVTVNLGSGRDQEPSLGPLGKSEHVHGSHERGLDGLYGVVLVVRGRCGTGEMVDLVDLDEEGLDYVVPDHLEVGVTDPVGDLKGKREVRFMYFHSVSESNVLTVVREPVKKLSRTVTSCPSNINRSTKWEPTNPAPPVTMSDMTLSILIPLHTAAQPRTHPKSSSSQCSSRA
jgi:hypothetical protein